MWSAQNIAMVVAKSVEDTSDDDLSPLVGFKLTNSEILMDPSVKLRHLLAAQVADTIRLLYLWQYISSLPLTTTRHGFLRSPSNTAGPLVPQC